jgi:hypothetical protein
LPRIDSINEAARIAASAKVGKASGDRCSTAVFHYDEGMAKGGLGPHFQGFLRRRAPSLRRTILVAIRRPSALR